MGETHSVSFASSPAPAEAPTTNDAAPETRPQWLPENFKAPEDLAKSYGEAQSELGKLRARISELEKGPDKAAVEEGKDFQDLDLTPEGSKGNTEEGETESKADEAVKETSDFLTSKGFDYDALSAEYAEHGDLKPETYEALSAKAGIPKEMVEQHIAGLKALAVQQETEVFNEVGGKDNFERMKGWAAESLSEQQKQAFNEAVNSDSIPRMKQAMLALKAAYEQANGRAPKLMKGTSNATPGIQPFRSRAEMQQAMSDPRYGTDAAYRQDVVARMAVTKEML